MSRRILVLLLASLALLVGLRVRAWSPARAAGACDLAARVTLDPRGGPVEVDLSLRGASAAEIRLGGLLPQRLFELSNLRATLPDGRPVELALSYQPVEAGSAVALYPRVSAQAVDGRPLTALDVHYSVRPGLHSVQVPCGEERHMGYVSAECAALSAANVLLLPDHVEQLELAVEAPEGWTTVSTVPARATRPTQAELWTWAFASGPLASTTTVQGIAIHDLGSPRSVPEPVRAVVERLTEYLGPPEQAISIALLPRAESLRRVESPPASRLVVMDMDAPDVGSLRELVRLLVPLWMGSSRFAEEKTAGGLPLLSGLSEYLAQHVPDDLALANTSSRRSIQYTWMRERQSASEDFSGGTVPLRHLEMVRRLKAPALIEEAMRDRRTLADRAELLREWRASDFGAQAAGDEQARDGSAAALLARIEGRSGRLGFERDWMPDARSVPPIQGDDANQVIHFAFTANTAGYLENCGCKVSQDGGVARRATALRELRAEHPDLVLLDAGNFAPIERNSAFVSRSVSREFEAYLDAMQMMRYDAVCIGNFELLAGLDWIAEHLDGRPLEAISNVTRADGSQPLPPETVLERDGLRIGVVSMWEKLDHGWSHEAQERNTVGLRFHYGLESIRPRLEALKGEVDLVVVAGYVSAPSLTELGASGLVDLVLSSATDFHDFELGALSRVGELVVASDLASSYGLNSLAVELDSAGRIAGAELEKLTLGDAVARDPDVQALLDALYTENAALADDPALRPLFGWDDHAQGAYAGYESCLPCHQSEFVQWIGTPHSSAMQTLRKARRDLNPECAKCHVLGLGREDGYRMGAPQPALEGVQCEACHGSGADHVAAPNRDNIRRRPNQQVCLECHDAVHSDLAKRDFDEVLHTVSHGAGRTE